MDYIKACSVYQNELSRRLVLITLIYYKLVTAVNIFEACDEDNKGYLSREDFKVAVVMLFGYKPSKVEVDSVMSSVRPRNSSNTLLFEKFLNLMSAMKAAQLYSNETRKMFSAFAAQDRGFLTFEDFQRAFNSVSPKLSEKNHIEAQREVDQDSDGRTSFKEFESAMKYRQDEVSPVYFA
ncbi:EF-hand calcium-binding domain-containing protein 11 [Harpia harpyja]|uniref:EF-hand calcium-binding domain-containing protein 11 n=1 Tax=Harpia harpyja TaxID=202280 RepID=UPI0022B20DB6|nr:EF-hand calcium-binding domain-containing protein 11 [Harpia harpyja]